MIDVLDRQDRRQFVHKKILGFAAKQVVGLIPGGSAALSLVSSLRGRSAPAPKGKARAAPTFRGSAVGFADDFIRRKRPPSIPPVNPVRRAVIQAKPVEALKPAPPIRRRIPQVFPVSRPSVALPATRRPVASPVRFDRAPIQAHVIPRSLRPAPIRSQVMPIHSRIRDFFSAPAAPAASLPCVFPSHRDEQTGRCIVGTMAGRDVAPGTAGDAVMGKFGAAYFPGSMIIDRAVCLPGDVVGSDGLCYPRRSIKNSDREWPRGRRPLLTGGDMRAISIAHRAGARMTRAAGRLQDMGIIKKPIVRKQIKKKS